MNFLVQNCKELNYGELLAVNGGCSGSCSGSYGGGYRPANNQSSGSEPKPDPKNYYQPPVYAPSGYSSACSGVCSGGYSPSHTLFSQHLMTEYNNPYAEKWQDTFTGNACAATSLLNEISEMYSKLTGKKLTESQAKDAIRAGVQNGSIDAKEAYVNGWEWAANTMAKSLGLTGRWKYVEDGSKADAVIISIDTDGNGYHNHFVNYIGEGKYYDPWTNKIGNVSALTKTSKWADGAGVKSAYRYLNYEAR